jgi:cell wall-associated NlpC family hydrolase
MPAANSARLLAMTPPCRQGSCPVPRHTAWLVAIMLSSSPAGAQTESQVDPLQAWLATRGESAAAPAPAGQQRDQASGMVIAAMNFVGVPYQRGGNNADSGFDCSGFTRHIFELSLGLLLPRRVDDQAAARGLVRVERTALRPGDLVFFNTLKRTFSHVGIYVGEGRFIHAPRSGSEVRIEDMRQAYWSQRFTGARRAGPADIALLAETTLAGALR